MHVMADYSWHQSYYKELIGKFLFNYFVNDFKLFRVKHTAILSTKI